MPSTSSSIPSLARLALVALALATGHAHGAIVVVSTLVQFSALTTAPGTDDYADFSFSSSTSSPLTRSTNLGARYAYTATASVSTFYGGAAPGLTNPFLSTNRSNASILFNGFAAGVNAIGGNFFTSDVNEGPRLGGGTIVLEVTDSAGSVTAAIVDSTPDSFRGFVSDLTLVSLKLSVVMHPGADFQPFVSADNLVLAQVSAVPEPGSWGLLLAGLGLISGAARRRGHTPTSAAAATSEPSPPVPRQPRKPR